MLRFALIENLRRLAVLLVAASSQRASAEHLIEEIVAPEVHTGTDLL